MTNGGTFRVRRAGSGFEIPGEDATLIICRDPIADARRWVHVMKRLTTERFHAGPGGVFFWPTDMFGCA